MEDFIAAIPLNAFPYILTNSEIVANRTNYSQIMTHKEAVRYWWFSYSDNFKFEIDIKFTAPDGEEIFKLKDSFNIEKDIENFGANASIDDTIERIKYEVVNEKLHYFSEVKENSICVFRIFQPYYEGEDSYKILFVGSYEYFNEYYDVEITVSFGATTPFADSDYLYEFSFDFNGTEVPCILHVYYNNRGYNVEATASASIDFGYLK